MTLLLLSLQLSLQLSFASTPDADFVQVPKGCLNHQYPCAVQVQKPGTLQVGPAKMQLSKNSQMILLGENRMQLVQGALWLRTGEITLRLGELEFPVAGEILYERSGARVVLRNLAGTSSHVPQGFENWYGGLGARGEPAQGVLRAIDLKEFMTVWLSIVGTTARQHEALLKTFKQNQKQAVAQSGELYQKAFDLRQIAAEQTAAEVVRRQELAEREKAEMRKMFRDRYFEGQ